MNYAHIPEMPIAMSRFADLAAAQVRPSKDALDLLLQKLPLLKSVFETEMKELKHLIEDLGPDYEHSQIYKDRVAENVRGNGPLHYQGFLSVLNAIYKDPQNAFHQALVQFMDDHHFLMTELLAKALLDKEVHEAAGGTDLSQTTSHILQWQSSFDSGSSQHLLAQKILEALQGGSVLTVNDLKIWIQTTLLKSDLYFFFPDLTQDQLFSLLCTTLGMNQSEMPKFTPLNQLFDRVYSYLKDPSTSQETRQFIQSILLPKMQTLFESHQTSGLEFKEWIAQNFPQLTPATDGKAQLENRSLLPPQPQSKSTQTAEPNSPPSLIAANESAQKISTPFAESNFGSLTKALFTNDPQTLQILKEMSNFPIIVPYQSSLPPTGPRFPKRKKPKHFDFREEDDLEEEQRKKSSD